MNNRIDLNFGWSYKSEYKDAFLEPEYDFGSWDLVDIPHTNVQVPYNNFDEKIYQIESCYKKSIFISHEEEKERYLLHFEGVMVQAKVYVNSRKVGSHKGGYTPFVFDITDYIKYGQDNLLTVCVDSREDEDIPPFGHVVDYLTYGGIYREVWLEKVSPVYIKDCHVITGQVLEEEKTIDLDLFLKNVIGLNQGELKLRLEKDKAIIKAWTSDLNLNGQEDQEIKISFDIKEDIELWDLDHPVLYDFVVEVITENGRASKIIRSGFRQVAFENDGFYLNGKKIKLRGLNRHQSFPYVGYAMPKSAQYRDAEILKEELGVNVVRSSHYPPSNHFLDRCDELGLLVFDEIPGWQHIGPEGPWWEVTLQQVDEMIRKDWNHPSVFMWGLRINESQDQDQLYGKTNTLANKLDPTRPRGGVRCIADSHLLEDVYTYNDFIHDGGKVILDKPKKITGKRVPYLVTEHNGHMFPTKKFDSEGRRIEQALRHMKVINRMMEDPHISGAIGWCMADYNTHQDFGSGDRICYHGVLDMFRIPKYGAYPYQSEGLKIPVMEVANSMESGDMDRSMRGQVWVFTNCQQVKLYINDSYINSFYPSHDAYPGLEHPPVIIDDFVGNLIHEKETFKPKDADQIKRLLIKADTSGGKLGPWDLVKMGWLFVKYGMTMKDGMDLYTKYFGGWGQASTTYRFEGLVDGKTVVTKEKGRVFHPSLQMTCDSELLVEGPTYDTTRMVLKLVDESGDTCLYANDAIQIETSGPISLMGPKVVSLIGGSVGFWVRSLGQSGRGSVRIVSERYGTLHQDLKVEKEIEN